MKNLVKNYALNLTTSDVLKYASKENIELTNDEANLIVKTIKENVDYILDGNEVEVLDSIKDNLSSNVYNYIVTLINKYSKFI